MKEFLPYDTIRNDALKLADQIYRKDNFIPDVIYTSLRGGAYLANVISEYYKIVLKDHKPVLFAAVVAHSYSDVRQQASVRIDGWTYSPEHLRIGDKIMLIDDIYDSGRTLNCLVQILMEKGIPREDIKVVVHDYKEYKFKDQGPVKPDYYSHKFVIERPEDNNWINYMSHEMVGLTKAEREEYYYKSYPELRDILEPIFEGQ